MRERRFRGTTMMALLFYCASCAAGVLAQDDAAKPAEEPLDPPIEAKKASGLVRLTEDDDLWIHPTRKLVIVDGKVCLREGQLEMFACPKGTKEHESIIAVNCKAKFIHGALEAVGAKAGRAVQFVPEYQPATGPIIDILLVWEDNKGQRQHMRAQRWVKDARTDKEMTASWVFAGSGFWTDEETGIRHYQADGGDMICVSNFPSAMLDLPVESSQANTALLFAAFTERIPPIGTKVRLVLIPRLKKTPAKKKATEPKADQ